MIPSWLPDTVTTAPDRMVDRALLWGLEGLELRTVGGPEERVPYVNEARLRRLLTESELAVTAVVPGLFEAEVDDRASWLNDLALLDETLAFCRRIGCRVVVVSSFRRGAGEDRVVEALRRAGDRAAGRDMALALLNEPGMGCETGAELGAVLGTAAHPAVRAAWDPAFASAAGEDPAESVRLVAPHAALVRYAVGRPAAVDWDAQFAALTERAFDGPISLVLPPGAVRAEGLAAATGMIGRMRAVAARR
jgi:sugar phosphate isomerase/epimerase